MYDHKCQYWYDASIILADKFLFLILFLFIMIAFLIGDFIYQEKKSKTKKMLNNFDIIKNMKNAKLYKGNLHI